MAIYLEEFLNFWILDFKNLDESSAVEISYEYQEEIFLKESVNDSEENLREISGEIQNF